MTDKVQEEFERWYLTTQPRARELKALDVTSKGDYLWDGVNGKYIGFQAAYNLREQEVQRLREALTQCVEMLDTNYQGLESEAIDNDITWEVNGESITAQTKRCLDTAKQALQETTNKE